MSRLAVLLLPLLLRLAVEPRPLLGDDVEDVPTLGSKDSPRLINRDAVIGGFQHQVSQNSSVLHYHEDSGEIYVGATNSLIQLDPENYGVTKKISLPPTEPCPEGSCENVVTVIQRFQDTLLVCGTNAGRPRCWEQALQSPSEDTMSYDATGISAFTHMQISLALTVEGDLYATAPLDTSGNSWQFRKKVGSQPGIWMDDGWLSEPTFIATSWVKQEDQPDNEKIYMFFREKNSDHSPEADPLISRVARVCKVDEGGSKRFLQNMWTSFLKARLVCGFPGESLYFNRLLDVYVTQPHDARIARVYALFTSSWNATAVCIYSIEDIERVFEESTFKGYEKDIPSPRPGACVNNSRNLPESTLTVVKNHPEMSDWVYPLNRKAPFYTSNNNYTKMVVDRVEAANGHIYNVLLLATDSGKIHKVVEVDSKPFVIWQTLSLSNSSPVHSMKLDPKRKRLIVGFSEKIAVVDLQRCQQYNGSCQDSVLARDPYCAWTKSGSAPTTQDGIQSIIDRHLNVCTASLGENRTKRDAASSPGVARTEHSVPLNVPFYLTCPIESYHADYTWRQQRSEWRSPCLQMRSNCLLLIPSMAPENYGSYECVSAEEGHVKVVKAYHLTQQQSKAPHKEVAWNRGPAAAPRLSWVTLGLFAVLLLR